MVAALAVLLSVACGSRFRADACPGNPFPEPATLLREPGFASLAYFMEGHDDRRPVDVEMWADAKFDFRSCLRYHYPKDDSPRSNCPAGVSLLIRSPITPEAGRLGEDFIAFFARRLSADLLSMRTAFAGVVRGTSAEAHAVLPGGLMAGHDLILQRTKYHDFQGPTPWRAVREFHSL